MLETTFAGIKMQNPTVLASGFLGTNAELLKRVVEEGGAGAVTMKSIGPKEKEGHPNPTVLAWEHAVINAVGLPTPGYKNLEDEWKGLEERNYPLIASIYGSSVEEFVEVTKNVASHKPEIIEVNISCPNVKRGQAFGVSVEGAKEVTEAVKKAAGNIRVMPKLTPQALNIAEIAKTCEKAGADAISAINTLGPGMLIDAEARKPVLANKFGGISGPAIKPIALRCVYNIFEAVKLPILGIGGISSGRDAIEMVMAGATATGIGSGIYYHGIGVFKKVCCEMQDWMKANDVKSLEEIRGCAHG